MISVRLYTTRPPAVRTLDWTGKDVVQRLTAILYPTRRELAKVLKRLLGAHYPLEGTSDHGVSEAIDIADPDGNGVGSVIQVMLFW